MNGDTDDRESQERTRETPVNSGHGKSLASVSGPFLRKHGYLIALTSIVGAKLWLDSSLLLLWLPWQVYDDGLYRRLAESIIRGEWLGSFDHLTLTKNPLYPLWVAAVHLGGIPLLLAQSCLYLGSGLLFVRELVLRGLPRPWALPVFAAFAFNPFLEVRLLREGIDGSLLVATIALGAGLERDLRQGRRALRTSPGSGWAWRPPG